MRPPRLGFVHGQIGLLQQIFHRELIAAEQGHTNADGAVVLPILHIHRLPQALQHSLCHRQCPLFGDCPVRPQMLQQHHEFITAHTRHAVALSHGERQAMSHLNEQAVSAGMPTGIVE